MAIVYCLEKPKDNDISKYGVIIVEGWAFSAEESIDRIEIFYGKKKINAIINIERKDVAKCHEQFYDKALYSGFKAEIELTEKEKKKEICLNIIIFSKNEKVKIHAINIQPEFGDINSKKFKQFYLATRKTIIYLKKGNFPKNLDELKICLYKFKNIAFNSSLKNLPEFKYNIEPYKIWCINNELNNKNIEEINKEIKEFSYKPIISIIMPAYKSDKDLLEMAIKSVLEQIYENWELCIVDDYTPENNIKEIVEKYSLKDNRIHFYRMEKNSHISAATNKGVSISKGGFIYLMDHDDLMTIDSLFQVVKELNKNKKLDIIYSDDDKITMSGERYEPQFKPDFSPELLLSYMYFSHIFVIRRSLFDKIGGMRLGYEGSQDYDLALRACEITNNICHIPKILYHWRATPTSTAFSANTKPYSLISGKKAVEDAVKRRNIPAEVIMPEFAQKNNLGIFALKYNGVDNPLISIIIPTKNHKDILERCINSIERKTNYKNYEIVIVDNESDEAETLEYLSNLKHKVIKQGNLNNKFNFSRMVNFGVDNCNGEYVVLLNNDTEVISESWLEDMLVYMNIDGVGVVGSKLLYADKTVQHAGVVLKMGNGVAGHAFKLINYLDGGYMSFANVARNYSAVTAACFMTTKKIFKDVNGFDEENFAVSYNDVDFCMKVQELGMRIVYNPQALLYHHEGKSRGVEQTGHFSDPKEEFNFISKWGIDSYFVDKYYNPNLSMENERFEIDYRTNYVDSRKPINVLLITHNLNFEGAPIVQKNVCLGLIKNGYKFTVLSMQDGPLAAEYKNAGVDVLITDSNPLSSCISKKSYYEYLNNTIKKLNNLEIGLVYANTIESFWGVDLAEMLGVPSIFGIHESVNYKKYFLQFHSFLQQAAIECFLKATKVIFVADATRNMYIDLDSCNFTTIHNGIDISKINEFNENYNKKQIKKDLGIDENKKVVSIIGTICYRKGQIIFAEAAKKILETRKDMVFYIVGGKEETYYQKLKAYIKENSLEDNIKILGPCKDVYKYYMISDVLVCASYEESSPMVILEAMSFKVPIVSTNVYGIPEQIRNNREGILVEPGKPEDIADSILKIIDDRKLIEELSYNAYYRILMKFSMETMLQEYDVVFQQARIKNKNKFYIFCKNKQNK